MSAHPRLTNEQIAYARRIAEIKRRIVRRLKRFPTVEQMAELFDCDARYLEKIIAGGVRKAPK